MNMGLETLNVDENETGSTKHENGTRRPLLSSKMSLGAPNMKTGPDNLKIAENKSRSAKHKNGTRLPRYHRKLVRESKI
jgi:hypothetical protein